MSMRKVFAVFCNTPACFSEFPGMRPAARAAGWICDSPRGLDYCPKNECQALAPKLKPRGVCAWCGNTKSLRLTGEPTQHLILDDVSGVKIRCPGSYMKAKAK